MLSPPHFVDTFPDEHEAQHLLNRDRLRLVRAGLSGASLALALAVVGCAARSLAVYDRTTLPEEWGLLLWPTDLATSPTKAVLASGCIVAVVSSVLLAASLVPRIHSRPTLLNICAAASTLTCFVLSAFSLAYSDRYDARQDPSTIHSWACRWQGVGRESHAGFSSVCAVTNAVRPLLITLVCVEAFVLGSTALAFWMESRVKKLQGFRLESKGVDMAP